MSRVNILYDEDCGFCRWALSKVLAWDRRRELNPVSLQSPEADRLLGEMPEGRRMASWHLIDSDGRVRSAGAALPALFRLLPGGRPVAAASARAPRLSERAYRLIADNRSRFGRLVPESAKERADRRIAERHRG